MFKQICTAVVITVLACGPRYVGAQQCCGDCDGNGEVAIDEIIKAVSRALDGCHDDGVCSQSGGQRFPASAQTTSYGVGSDGDVKAGATLSYTDNGDGTITDNNTGLMWEKKDYSGSIHDIYKSYEWGMSSEPYTMNGTMVTEFLATLNRAPCFAGHCDWRIPNVKELQSIVDYEVPYPGPTVNAAFHTNCVAGCSGSTNGGPICSCTAAGKYWSSTTYRGYPNDAWYADFGGGYVVGGGTKSYDIYVRAVRGGL
jgi:hypothetical protein